MNEDNKHYVVKICSGRYFQRYGTSLIHNIPYCCMTDDINQAARMDREGAMKVAKMYGGEVIEREGGLYG